MHTKDIADVDDPLLKHSLFWQICVGFDAYNGFWQQ